MKKMKLYLGVFSLIATFGVLLSISMPLEALASTAGEIREGVDSVADDNTAGTDLEDIIRIIINAILFLVGIVAVIMIIIGGFRYVVAQGDSGQLTSAKNTILYAVVGLVIAIAAFAIVNFVLDAFING